MTRLEQGIHDVMNERGITVPNWRIKITNREIIGKSDWAKVTVEVYAPRKRKPTVIWILSINFVRETVHWDKSSFYYPA